VEEVSVDTDVKMLNAGEEEGEADEGRTDQHDDGDDRGGGGVFKCPGVATFLCKSLNFFSKKVARYAT
jgi:hypothetical protein